MSGWLFIGFITAGLVLAFNGVVQLCVRKKTGLWKEGGAILLAGAIITVVLALRESLGVMDMPVYDFSHYIRGGSIIAGPILALNGVVQLCVRKKTGPWREGGASLLAGAIIVFLARLAGIKGVVTWFLFRGFLTAGLVLAFNGVVQLCVRKKTGLWKEGGASLLAGAIIVGGLVSGLWLAATKWPPTSSHLDTVLVGFMIAGMAGMVLAFNGVVQLCVRKKTGPWREGGASLLAGAIIVGVLFLQFFLRRWGRL